MVDKVYRSCYPEEQWDDVFERCLIVEANFRDTVNWSPQAIL